MNTLFSSALRGCHAALAPIRRNLRDLYTDTAGAAVVLMALMFPVVIGGMGLGAETGFWYMLQRALQLAADVSAHAGGVRYRAGDAKAGMQASAMDVAVKSGFKQAEGTFTLNSPPTTGPYAGNIHAVEVILTKRVPRLLSAIFNNTPVDMRGRAVALVSLGSNACVLSLAPSGSGALSVAGSSTVNLVGCDAVSNSVASDSLIVSGSGSLSARCASTVGGAVVSSNVTLAECEKVEQYAPVVPDPYRDVVEPAIPSSCNSNTKNLGNPNTTTTVTPGPAQVSGVPVYRFCGGVTIKGTVNFEPGLYIISGGDLDANAGAQINGTGVTFFVTSPNRITLNGHAQLNLSAPTSGPYAGLLFFASRSGSGLQHVINGTAGSRTQGAIYAPTTSIEASGNSTTGSGGSTQVVAYRINFTGNSGLGSDCSSAGTRDIKVNESVRLVE